MAVAVKEIISRFETLKTNHRLYGCNREVILSGFYPQVDPYMAYPERAFLRLRIQLVGEDECSFTVNELSQIFSEFIRVNYPTGRTENYPFVSSEYCACSYITGEHYLEAVFHCYDDKAGEEMYNRLQKEFFPK